MKSLLTLAFVMLTLNAWSEPTQAQDDFLNIYCDECRAPRLHHIDYRNFAYNQVFGPAGWMTYDQANFFRITNANGQSVIVDINLDLKFFTLELGLPIPLPYPIAVVVQVIVIFPNGDQIVENLDPRAHPKGLPVGKPGAGGTRSGGPGYSGRSGPGGGGGPSGPDGPGPRGRCGSSEVDGDSGTRRRTCS